MIGGAFDCSMACMFVECHYRLIDRVSKRLLLPTHSSVHQLKDLFAILNCLSLDILVKQRAQMLAVRPSAEGLWPITKRTMDILLFFYNFLSRTHGSTAEA